MNTQRGDVTIYISLLLLLIVTTGTMVMSGLLSRQPRISRDTITSEQAFYAANSGVEHALYEYRLKGQEIPLSGEIQYGSRAAKYDSDACIVKVNGIDTLAASSTGTFRTAKRGFALAGRCDS